MTDATVFIVDDDAAIRDALSLLISLKGLRAATFATAAHFLSVYDPRWRGCLLTDLKMPEMDGLALQAALTERGARLPVVFLTAHGDVPSARMALKNGAVDFLEKPIDDDVLLDVLRNALSLDAERHQLQDEPSATSSRMARLTSREREVLDLLAKGASYRDIGGALGISPRTAEVYKSRMMEKLQCDSLADLIRFSMQTKTSQ